MQVIRHPHIQQYKVNSLLKEVIDLHQHWQVFEKAGQYCILDNSFKETTVSKSSYCRQLTEIQVKAQNDWQFQQGSFCHHENPDHYLLAFKFHGPFKRLFILEFKTRFLIIEKCRQQFQKQLDLIVTHLLPKHHALSLTDVRKQKAFCLNLITLTLESCLSKTFAVLMNNSGIKYSLKQTYEAAQIKVLGKQLVLQEQWEPVVIEAIKRNLSKFNVLKKLRDSLLTMTRRITRKIFSSRSLYLCFFKETFYFASGLGQHHYLSEICSSLSTSQKTTYSRVLKLLNIHSEEADRLEFSLNPQQLVLLPQVAISKDEDFIEIQFLVEEQAPMIESTYSSKSASIPKLSQIRQVRRELTKSNIRRNVAQISYVFDYLSQEQQNHLKCRQHSQYSNRTQHQKKKKQHNQIEFVPEQTVFAKGVGAFELSHSMKMQYIWKEFKQYGYWDMLQIDSTVFGGFMNSLIYHYSKYNNSFHNFDHAFTVMQGALYLSQHHRCKALPSLDVFAFVLSALCHDVGHTGRNNAFEAATNSKLAVRYFDRSILESHHIGLSFKLFAKWKILTNFSSMDFGRFKKTVSECILSTDSRFHSLKMNQFKLFLTEYQSNNSILNDVSNLHILLGTSLHGVDFFGNVQPFPTSSRWAKMLHVEFQQQYNMQLQLKLNPTPFYAFLDNPKKTAQSEVIFIENVVLPLWKELNGWYEDSLQEYLNNISLNIAEWRKIQLSD